MLNIVSTRTTLPAGGGDYELTSLSVGIFLNHQPSHHFSLGGSKLCHQPLQKRQGWILPAGSNGICAYDDSLDFIMISLKETVLAEFGLEKPFDFPAIVGTLDSLLVDMCLNAPNFAQGGTLYRETMNRALAAQIIQTIKPLPSWQIGIEDQRLRHVLDYIHDNLAEDLTLAQMADLAAMSPTHFAKSFKKETGQSPLQYVIQARLDMAAILLKTTKLAVAEIAWRVGYQDISRFGQHFKRKFATPPAAYRQTHCS